MKTVKRFRFFSSGRFFFILLIFAVTSATVGLGIMQFRWISRAAQLERTRHISAVARDGTRALNMAFDELRLISHLIHTAVSDLNGESDTIEAVLASWKEQSSFKEFVRGVWIAPFDGGRVYHAAAVSEESRSEFPEELSYFTGNGGAGLDPKTARDILTALGLRGYTVQELGDREKIVGYAVISFDTDVFMDQILPHYLSTELSGYNFSVSRNRETEFAGPDFFSDRPSDRDPAAREPVGRFGLVLSVPGFFRADQDSGNGVPPARDIDAPGRFRPGNRGFGVFSKEQLGKIQSLLNRDIFRVQDEGMNRMRIGEALSIGHVEIFLAPGLLDREIDRWVFSNTAVSTGVLLLLLLCLVAVLLLYSRTGAMRMKEQEFVALMSHELRLPVTVIKAIADNITQGIVKNPEKMRRYGAELGTQANRLASMIEGILLYSGLQSENRKAEHRPVDLHVMTDAIANDMQELFDRKTISFEKIVSAGDGEIVADSRGIQTIIENLLMNAVIHAEPGEPGVQRKIRLVVQRYPFDNLKIIVEDNGRGIPGREQRSVFLPFVRSQYSIKHQLQGSGLGLHIVRRIALLSGGNVSLASPYTDASGMSHSGCRFTVTVKIRETVHV